MSELQIGETLIGLAGQYSPSGQEGAAVRWLVERMRSLGYEGAFIDEVGNAVGTIGKGPHQIMLLGHIDTVSGWIPPRVEDGVVYGRGVVDAKGALACFTDAAVRCGAAEGWQLVVIGAVDEERDSRGAWFTAEQYRPEYAVIGEPNRWNRIALGYKGCSRVRITLRRGQSHSAGGVESACEAAVEVWQAIKRFAEEYNTGKPRVFDQVLPSLQGLDSGAGDFDQWAALVVSARLPPAVSPQDWFVKLEELCGDGRVQQVGKPIPAWVCDKNTRVVRALLAGIRAEGGEPAFVYKTGTADLNIVAPQWGCPALVYGPGDSALDHTPHEKLELAEYQKSVRVLESALRRLMEKPEN